MGACEFSQFGKGKNAADAFSKAVERAEYEYGHGGYSGTLAEKHEFVVVGTAGSEDEARKLAEEMLEKGDARIDSKWGPAGCIKCGSDTFLFFGWASS